MTTHQDAPGEPFRLPDITRQDRARFVKEARRLRAEEIDRRLRAATRGLGNLWRACHPRAVGHRPSERTS